MKQEKIRYKDVIDLGFKEQICSDNVYFNEFGFKYAIITKYLTKKIYLDWVKETQLCEIIRINNKRDFHIIKRSPIKNLTHLKEIIDFFSDEKELDVILAC